jgi:hypothetical protein
MGRPGVNSRSARPSRASAPLGSNAFIVLATVLLMPLTVTNGQRSKLRGARAVLSAEERDDPYQVISYLGLESPRHSRNTRSFSESSGCAGGVRSCPSRPRPLHGSTRRDLRSIKSSRRFAIPPLNGVWPLLTRMTGADASLPSMANPRVHEVAADFGVDSKMALDILKDRGEFVKSAASSIAPPVARRLARELERQGHTRVGRVLTVAEPFSLAAAPLTQRFPATVPRFVDLLMRGLGEARSVASLRSAVADRHFYYVVLGSVPERFTVASTALPSPSGIAIVSTRDRGLFFVAWRPIDSRLFLHSGRIDLGTRGVSIAAYQTARAQLVDERWTARPGEPTDPLALLGSLGRLPPRKERAQTRAPDRVTQSGVPAAESTVDPDVRVVYLSAGDTRGKSSGIRASARSARWQVRGHWRNHWHPKAGKHERIWISTHAAGPIDGRPIVHDVVYVVHSTA